jgi:hypothetical protein
VNEYPATHYTTDPPAKPAQPTIADLYAEITALRKERDALLLQIDAERNRTKAEAFNPKVPSIHDHNATLTATGDGVTVRANRHGWVAFIASGVEGEPLKAERDASPYSNFQAAVVELARAGIAIGEPQLVLPEASATLPAITPPTPA